jgi:hypothetical protein
MKKVTHIGVIALVAISLGVARPARADLFGGDIVVLSQILIQAVQQLAQLKQIFSTGADTVGILRDANRGVRDGLAVIQILNPKFNPGLYGSLGSADQVLKSIEDLYGRVPMTGEARLQQAQDNSVAESIAMNATLFKFADQADEESRRIINHSQEVNPQGAAKLTAQSVAILINVSTQVLRTNSMMLKMMSENVALQNRRDKLQSSQFKTQYDGISTALGSLPKDTALSPLESGGK